MDLGTANTIIISDDKIVVDEPSVVALDRRTDKMIAVGGDAKMMYEKEHPNIRTIRPLHDGVIADFTACEQMMRGLIKMVHSGNRFFSPSLRMVIGVPSGSTEVELRAVRDSAEHADGRDVYLIFEPMAAALGMGLDVEAPEGNMIVDIGGGSTEIAVISLGGIVCNNSLRVAGDDLTADIQEYMSRQHNVKVSERALRELYLKGFEIAVKESSPWTIMTSYNRINGTYTSESPWLLQDVLRDEWGFEGIVMTDWFAGADAVKQMQAGNDLLMPGTQSQQQALLNAARNGQLDVQVLDRNIERILDLIMRTRTFRHEPVSNRPDLDAHARISRKAATEGMVLLKNERDALPLAAGKKLALFGNSAYDIIIGGTGSGDVHEAYSVALPEGLENAGYATDKALSQAYAEHIKAAKVRRPETNPFLAPPPLPELVPTAEQIGAAVAANDVGVITIGRNSGEFIDRKAEGDFYLTEAEQTLIKTVSAAFHKAGKPVVVVLNVGGVIEVASWRDQVDAILLAWQPGQEAGHAMADVLSGKVNPSGKLTDTFALDLKDYPAAENFPGVTLLGSDPAASGGIVINDRAAEVEYRDDIRVGYRHFNTRDVEVAYPFGYGLSYTRFEYRDLKLTREDAGFTASVIVTNTGRRAGKEVVQLYVSAPNNVLEKPAAELRAYARTRLLQPGQSQTLVMRVEPRGLTSFDPEAHRWVAHPGRYTVRIGASSRDIRQQAHFDIKDDLCFMP